MSENVRQGWMIELVPGAGESFGHYLNRFRRENCLSHRTLGEVLAVPPKVVSEWEVPSRRRIPDVSSIGTPIATNGNRQRSIARNVAKGTPAPANSTVPCLLCRESGASGGLTTAGRR